jgi:hypothetical protein
MIGRQTFASLLLLASCGYYRANATKGVEESGGVPPISCTALSYDNRFFAYNTYTCIDSTERQWQCSYDGGCIVTKETK